MFSRHPPPPHPPNGVKSDPLCVGLNTAFEFCLALTLILLSGSRRARGQFPTSSEELHPCFDIVKLQPGWFDLC